MQNMALKADELAAKAKGLGIPQEFDAVRDWVDTRTGGDLDCVELDLLTDCVLARLAA